MIRTPNTPNTLIDTFHRLRNLPQLLPISIPQQLRLLQHLLLRQIPHTYRFFAAVDVGSFYDWVFAWARGDSDFDLRVCGGEFGERVAEEGTVWFVREDRREREGKDVLHALGAAGPVAVVEVKAFALQDEGSNTVLWAR
jgi:hypothetical protein